MNLGFMCDKAMILKDNNIDLDDYLAFIGQQESQEVRPAEDFGHDLFQRVAVGNVMHGPAMPWIKTHDTIRFQPGELSIWAGINGHGKSLLLGQVVLWWLKEQTALIASLEMRPVETLYRMCRQHKGGMFDVDYLDRFMADLSGRLWIYDQLDSVESERILGLIHYAASELQVDHIVIDSLTKCGLSRDDYAVQARFVDRIQWAAKRHRVHVHLVCHMRKGNDENTRPGKFDIRGAAEISDLADNVLVVYRNKPKEEACRKRAAGQMLTRAEEMDLTKPDTILRVDKNRANGGEESFGLWFHQGAMQFLGSDMPQSMTWGPNE